MVRADLLCAVLVRYARENRTPLEIKYRSAAGATRQLRKSYKYHIALICNLQSTIRKPVL